MLFRRGLRGSGRNWWACNQLQRPDGLLQCRPFKPQFLNECFNLDGVLSNPNQRVWLANWLNGRCIVKGHFGEHVGERDAEGIRDSGDAHHGHPRLFGTFEVAEIGPVHTYAFARSCLAPATLLSQIPNPLAEAPYKIIHLRSVEIVAIRPPLHER